VQFVHSPFSYLPKIPGFLKLLNGILLAKYQVSVSKNIDKLKEIKQ